MAGSASPSPKPSRHEQRFNERRQEYQDYLPLTERVEEQLRGDVEELMAQEGWDAETRNGVEEWLRDRDNVWRALRRYRYDENKAHALLLSDLAERVNRQLHKPIPLTDLTNSPLFFVLPLPRFVDRLGRPVVVLTLSEVARDENGSLDDVKEWTWWALEKLRRTVHDWWTKGAWSDGGARARKARGYGGEGCVVLVNAAGAGYRNLEVELLPTLLSVGHNHFPGIIEAVYVVNAKWTHRSMWSVVKQVMPRTALDKFAFLDDSSALKEVFDLERLPSAYGGRHPWTFGTAENAILLHYAHQPIPAPKPPSPSPISSPSAVETPSDPSHASPARTASYTSIADVYYSAQNSPGQSRQASRRGSTSGGPSLPQGLRMTGVTDGTVLQRSRSTTAITPRPTMTTTPSGPPSPTHSEHVGEAAAKEEEQEENVTSPFEEQFARGRSRASSRKSSRRSSPRSTPLQRIKSLSNFHLYLSPSRLAPPALLSDSEDDMPPLPPPRKVLRPVVMDPEATIRAKTPTPQTLAERRARPGLNIHGIPAHMTGDETVRTYSDRLQLHHAKAMQAYRSASQQPEPTQRSDNDVTPKAVNPVPRPVHVPGPSIESPGLEPSPTPSPPASPSPAPPQSLSISAVEAAPESGSGPTPDSGALSAAQPVSAFSSTNPWFGYPAERVPDSSQPGLTVLRPRYPRNRKRDLVKTLLFLFMLRLQAWRDAFERLLGLNHLRTWTASTVQGQLGRTKALTPDEGLMRTAQVKRAGAGDAIMRSGYWERDWVWMVIGFLLLRGTWTRILSAPLEAVGLESVRDMLGLV